MLLGFVRARQLRAGGLHGFGQRRCRAPGNTEAAGKTYRKARSPEVLRKLLAVVVAA
ncbi:MAG: hypothetical protein IPK27_15700 [Rhodanobacteraceae bacterium]|nr:hypothetical protein [Rhodanobacteraceae bacterium]